MQTLIERPPNNTSKDHANVAVFPPLPFALAVVAGVLVRRYSSSMMATFHGSYKEESTLRKQSRYGFIKDVAHADWWYQVNTAGQVQSGLWAHLLLGSGRSRRSWKYRSDQSARIPRGWSEKRNGRAKDQSAHSR